MGIGKKNTPTLMCRGISQNDYYLLNYSAEIVEYMKYFIPNTVEKIPST